MVYCEIEILWFKSFLMSCWFTAGPEGDIRMYLDHLAEAENVKEYVKMNPFGLPPITESHADWNYYQDLLKQCLKEN